jgi:hypothetical protein
MVNRADLLIAVVGIVVSVVGSSTALWMAVSKKADREDLSRLETRMESGFARLDSTIDGVETRLDRRMDRIETKLDALILRFVPEQLPQPEN